MDLHDAATFFDNDAVLDGYSGVALFEAQVASFDDSSSDGATNRRRVLSTAPGVVIPARRCILVHGDRWLVGTGTPDGFMGSVIRQHFNTKRVTDLLALLTPNEARGAAAGVSAYAQKMYFKDTSNALTDSEYDAQWNIFVAPGEPASKGSFLRDAGGKLYRVRNDYIPTEGLRILQADELDAGSVKSCTYDTGVWDPVTETYGAGTTVLGAIMLDAPQAYRFRHMSDERLQPGDATMIMSPSAIVKQGATFTMSGQTWRIMSVQTELDAKLAHVRLA